MIESGTGQGVLTRLDQLRATVRRRLVAYGCCAVLGGGMLAFLTVIALDWMLGLPPALRLLGLILFISGFILSSWHWVLSPLRAPVSRDDVAGQLEQRFPQLREQLRSSVNFLEQSHGGSEPMARRVIEQTERLVDTLQFGQALAIRPLAVRAGWLLLGISAFALLVAAVPDWVSIGLKRYLQPLGPTEWPRSVAIRPISGDLTVPVGDSVTVRMEVDRGLHDALRAVLCLRDESGQVSRLAMHRDADETFYFTVDSVTVDLAYWFEAGDDSTERAPAAIRTVRRPEVSEAVVTVRPPAYAATRTARVHDLNGGPVKAPIGGMAEIAIRSTKPIPREDAAAARLRLADDATIALQSDPADPLRATASLVVEENLDFRVELRDELGFENRAAVPYAIVATPDMPPMVTVVEPRGGVELTPVGSLPISIRVEDDFGVTSMALQIEPLSGTGAHTIDLTTALRAATSGDTVEFAAQYRWGLASMNPSPGDVLEYYITAVDNRDETAGGGQPGRSSPLRVKIITDVEFELRLRDDIANLEGRVRQISVEQTEMLDRTAAASDRAAQSTTISPADRTSVDSLGAQQARLSRRVADLARRFRELGENLERNRPGDRDAAAQLAAVAAALQHISADAMTEAGRALNEAREQSAPDEMHDRLESAERSEENVLAQLRTMLGALSRWGNFQSLVTKTRDLLDRQQGLRQRTGEFGKATLGRDVSELSEAEAAQLRKLAWQQQQLAGDVDQLLERMRQLQPAVTEKDPAAGESIDAAMRAAAAADLSRRLDSASEALQQNRTAAASAEQKAAGDALRKLLAALEERDTRELAQLRKRLDRAREQVAELLDEQQTIFDVTREASTRAMDQTDWATIQQQQRSLRRNTASLADELVEMPRMDSVARPVKQAATPMTAAEDRLQQQAAIEALPRQTEAIELLREALAELDRVSAQSEHEALVRTLGQIEEDLDAIITAQREVLRAVVVLRAAVEAQGRVARGEAREAARLARDQAAVREMVEALRPDFEKVVVFSWALERTADRMDDARERLETRRVDGELVDVINRIIKELERLLQATIDTRTAPMDLEFTDETESDGEGQPAGEQGANVPTMAELLVLRAMQADLLERTASAQQTQTEDGDREAMLREIASIGEDQKEVQRLTDMLTQKARQP